jgi:hypothetical protein
MSKYETRVEDYNFGSLLRISPDKPYTEENSIFGEQFEMSTDVFNAICAAN